MAAKIPKCLCIGLQGSTGRLVDPKLCLNDAAIPFTTDPVRFLGLNVQVPSHNTSSRPGIISRLDVMLTAVDAIPLTKRQKLLMYSAGICPRLTWPLLIQELPTSWVEKELDSRAARYLKQWSGLSKSANMTILHLPHSRGGLNLPQLSTMYRKLQVSRHTQLLTSRDGCVRFLADQCLKRECRLSRLKFRPATQAREVLAARPGGSRKALARAAKALVAEEVNAASLDHWHSLERQGHMGRCMDLECAKVWATVVKALPEEQMKFVLNAALDTLPHNANLHLWQKKTSSACHLCGNNQSLLHVLNNCTMARDLHCYNMCHDLVLQEIASAIKPHLKPTTILSVDLGKGYEFPTHIVPTDLRPDIVWWDSGDRFMGLAELTVCFESNFKDAARRKTAKYMDLLQQARNSGYRAQLLTLEVGSRGVPHFDSFKKLSVTLSMTNKELNSLLQSTARAAIAGSFKIWCSRNKKT